MKKLIIIPGIIIVILLGILIFYPEPREVPPSPNSASLTPQSVTSSDGHVEVSSPVSNDMVASPVTISGTVTGGGWFYEATFPIKILDADGTILGTGQAQAEPSSAWTSTGTVSFSAIITFAAPHFATGNLIFSKDNPSGAPANAESFSVPVRFK